MKSINIQILLFSSEFIESSVYSKFCENIDFINQIEREALCKYVIDDVYQITYNISIGEICSLLSYTENAKELIAYTKAIYKSVYDKLLIRYLGDLNNYIFTFKDVIEEKFTMYLYDLIRRKYL